MDDQQTYLLNGLIARQFAIGRIVRFRQVTRGRQAECFELFTAQEKEYQVYLYPPTFAAAQLEFAARAVNALDENRFSVMPFMHSKQAGYVAEGPQGRHMLVGLAASGTMIAPADFTAHDISQVGLRLAWMHRLLRDQIKPYAEMPSIADRFYDHFFQKGPGGERPTPAGGGKFAELYAMLRGAVPQGWVHGDITPAALLHDGDHQLRTVTDWGHLHWGCPLQDLVGAFLFLSTNREGLLERPRGHALMEAYDSLIPLKGIAWTPVVASWCAQRMIAGARRHETGEPAGEAMETPVVEVLRQPERIAVAMAACLKP